MSHSAYMENLLDISQGAAKRIAANAEQMAVALREASRELEHSDHTGPCTGCWVEGLIDDALTAYEKSRADYNTAMIVGPEASASAEEHRDA